MNLFKTTVDVVVLFLNFLHYNKILITATFENKSRIRRESRIREGGRSILFGKEIPFSPQNYKLMHSKSNWLTQIVLKTSIIQRVINDIEKGKENHSSKSISKHRFNQNVFGWWWRRWNNLRLSAWFNWTLCESYTFFFKLLSFATHRKFAENDESTATNGYTHIYIERDMNAYIYKLKHVHTKWQTYVRKRKKMMGKMFQKPHHSRKIHLIAESWKLFGRKKKWNEILGLVWSYVAFRIFAHIDPCHIDSI